MPQRGGLDRPVPAHESSDGISIHRIALPLGQGGALVQATAFGRYFFGVTSIARRRRYDVVVATSGRLMTGVLGSWVARRQRAPFYLDLRDIFVENIYEMLPRVVAMTCGWFFDVLERWTVCRASRVNLVSAGFAAHFVARYPCQRFTYFTNGIDDEFCEWRPLLTERRGAVGTDRELRILYAGNIGDGQGLHRIVPEVARRLGNRVRFRIVGDGNSKERLVTAIAAAGATNVELMRPLSRARLLDEYRSADVLFVHLNDYEAFQKVLPSKLFEYGATGKPIWAGLAGYPAEFVCAEITNAAVFPPCNAEAAIAALSRLELTDRARPEFVEKYSRRTISRELAGEIIGLLHPGAAPREFICPDR
jgi:glycosyltransferase involved in cell wall biosynthesis